MDFCPEEQLPRSLTTSYLEPRRIFPHRSPIMFAHYRSEKAERCVCHAIRVKEKNVKILNQLRPEQLSEIYGLSDFAVLPYICEGNSHAVLEACSSNLPLVTTPVGLFWDFWDERVGYRVSDPFDTAEYVQAVSKMVVESPVLQPRKMIIEKQLDLGTWGKRWVDYLVSLVPNKS